LVELSELIRQTQAETERGDYEAAARLCEHAVEHAPSCFSAHRLLGEIRLELHDVDAAIEHFQIALNYDPMSVIVRLGMGAAAEDRGDAEAAYACYLHAWEINPDLVGVRDRLVQLRRTHGVNPRLHLTRAGLASVHLRAGRFERAIAELRSLVAAEPRGRRARCALVEALWRNGDDAAATVICQSGLDEAPENGRYLAVLAEIEHRLRAPFVEKTLARLHAIDPLGEIAALMAEWRPDRDVSALFARPIMVPDVASRADERPIPVTAMPFAAPPALPAAIPESSVALAAAVAVPAVAGLDASIQPFVWDEAPASLAPDVVAPAGWDDWRRPAPVAPATAVRPTESVVTTLQPVRANGLALFETSDGGIDLTAGWDELDQVLADATPPARPDDRFADLMAELSVEGLTPFQAVDRVADESAWEPLFAMPEPAVDAIRAIGAEQPAVDSAARIQGAEPALAVAPMSELAPTEVTVQVDATPVAEPMAAFAAAPLRAAAAVEIDEFAELTPFSFEETVAHEPDVELPFDFGDLDAPAMPPRPPRRISRLHAASGAAVAAAVAEIFPDSDDESGGAAVLVGPAPTRAPVRSGPPVSIFQVLRASKQRRFPRPVWPRDVSIAPPRAAATPSPMFHVEHREDPGNVPAPLFAIGRDELMTLRIRLIEEEHSAGDIARTLEAKLSDGRADPLAARVLGEAYLRLGKSDQAAAQFRQAMLARGRGAGSVAR